MQVARCVQTTQNRKSVIFLLRVLQLLLCSIVMQRIQIFYRDPAIFIVTCFLAQPDCTNFLPKHCNTMIKHQLCREGFPSLFSLLQVDVFPEKQTILHQIILYPSNKPKKKLVSGLVIQTIPSKVLQESTTILQLKVYIVYVVRTLIGHPP